MQVRRLGVAGVADVTNLLAPTDSAAGSYVDTSLPHVRIERIDTMRELDDCEVTIGLIERQTIRQLARNLIRQIVARGHDGAVRDRVDRLSVNAIVAAVNAAAAIGTFMAACNSPAVTPVVLLRFRATRSASPHPHRRYE
jgi:hypothetical protein